DAPAVPADEQASFDDLAADHADADWIAPTSAPTDVQDDAAQDEPVRTEESAHGVGPTSDPAPFTGPPAAEPEAPAPTAESPTEPEHAAEEAPARKKGRSSVPSWDEIMFGGGKND
ncbi:MAG: hypothetical protein ACJ72O_05340, partial [Marmoricola sp.]